MKEIAARAAPLPPPSPAAPPLGSRPHPISACPAACAGGVRCRCPRSSRAMQPSPPRPVPCPICPQRPAADSLALLHRPKPSRLVAARRCAKRALACLVRERPRYRPSRFTRQLLLALLLFEVLLLLPRGGWQSQAAAGAAATEGAAEGAAEGLAEGLARCQRRE